MRTYAKDSLDRYEKEVLHHLKEDVSSPTSLASLVRWTYLDPDAVRAVLTSLIRKGLVGRVPDGPRMRYVPIKKPTTSARTAEEQKLVIFLQSILETHLPVGVVERLVHDATQLERSTKKRMDKHANPHLARISQELAALLKE